MTEEEIKKLKEENELLKGDLEFACFMLGLEYCYKEPDTESVNRLVTLIDMIPKPEDLTGYNDIELINNKAPKEKRCKEYVIFGEDVKLQCDLENGHHGPHHSSGYKGTWLAHPYQVRWHGFIANDCAEGGHRPHHYFYRRGKSYWACECWKKWFKEVKSKDPDESTITEEIDEPPLWVRNDLIKSDEHHWVKAKGENVCHQCKKHFSEHPWFEEIKGYDGEPFLIRLCDGSLINLC